MARRFLSLLLALALVFSVAPQFVGEARAEETYNVAAAVEFALGHWNDGIGLCGEFVSRCLKAGGITIPNKYNYYRSTTISYDNNRGKLGNFTNPYKCPASLLLYLADYYEIIKAPAKSQMEVGDIAFMPGGTGGPFPDGHVGIIISTDGGVPIYAAHNNDTKTGKFYSNNACTYLVKMSRPLNGSGAPGGNNGESGNEEETTPTCGCDESLAGTYICTTESTKLNIRGGHGTSFDKVGSIPKGAEVKVLKAGSEWAHVEYNGIEGYASMDYLTRKTFTVIYNANGGSGAPGNQIKTHGTALTLSAAVPTRTGYTFQGWATSASGAVAYQKGGSYTTDANVTLYAVWKINSYTVSYNANGGSGAPGNQTKTHGTALTLSAAVPTRTGYTFQGWATSASGAVAYQKGGSYTTDANVTLYAVWQREKKSVGDADGDGYVTENDALLIRQYRVGLLSADQLNLSACDLDGNGQVDIYDSYLIQLYAEDKIRTFPVEG